MTHQNGKSAPGPTALSLLTRIRPGGPNLQVHRADTEQFATFQGLQIQAGTDRLRAIVLKELVDNALDAADKAGNHGQAKIERIDGDSYRITDHGNGISGSAQDLADLFAIKRPMISGKFYRLPQRGALGNGLRVIVGSLVASCGTIEIVTRGYRTLLRPLKVRTEIIETAEVEHQPGTVITIKFGPSLPENKDDLDFAVPAISLARNAKPPYDRDPSLHWFDLDHLTETLASLQPQETTVRQFLEQFDGCSGSKAGKLAAPFGKNRSCNSMTQADAEVLLIAAKGSTRPVKAIALGPIGPAAYPGREYSRREGVFLQGKEPRAEIPFIVEAWVYVGNRKGKKAGLEVFANRTSIVAYPSAYYGGKGIRINGVSGLQFIEQPKGDCSISLHVTSPFIPIEANSKRPNFRVFSEQITEAITRAFTRSRNGCVPDPEEPKPVQVKPDKPQNHKTVVLAHMHEAILATSGDGKYIFSQRNLFYKMRPIVEKETGGALSWGNFTSILTDYENDNGRIENLIRDERGSYHDRFASINLGTTGVSNYSRGRWVFHKLLVCEKEDHVRILRQAGWDLRNDCAVMSARDTPLERRAILSIR